MSIRRVQKSRQERLFEVQTMRRRRLRSEIESLTSQQLIRELPAQWGWRNCSQNCSQNCSRSGLKPLRSRTSRPLFWMAASPPPSGTIWLSEICFVTFALSLCCLEKGLYYRTGLPLKRPTAFKSSYVAQLSRYKFSDALFCRYPLSQPLVSRPVSSYARQTAGSPNF